MAYQALFIWVEGSADVRFFDHVVAPVLRAQYDSVVVRAYRQERPVRVSKFVRGIRAQGNAYFFVGDMDEPVCIARKKEKIRDKYTSVEDDRIVVVVMEIEGWYLAGLDDAACDALGVPRRAATDTVTKEEFERLRPGRFDSKIDFEMEILKRFSDRTAKSKNRSFKYFAEKHRREPATTRQMS